MNWIKFGVFFSFILFANLLQAQVDEAIDSTLEDDESRPVKILPDDKYKFGIKLGSQLSTLMGEENSSNTLNFGLNGGVYMRRKFKSQKWGYQLELNGSFRGSNFAPKYNEYSAIRLFYLDMPLLVFVNLTKDENHKLLFGPQVSYLLSSSIYNGPSLVSYDSIPSFKKLDLLACVGYHIRLGHVSFQTMLKYGFISTNDGLLPGIKPTNTGKSMNNFIFELNFLF
ncbi:MAG: outer membrane beta-barrel protein [Bacteroidia bacterium]